MKRYKVLLLGAYANGNIGDMYQADALAAEILNLPVEVEVFSVSPSTRRAEFSSERHTVLPPESLSDPALLNSHDVILVGGGGLLSAAHPPLNDKSWVDSISTRLCAVSIGASQETALECQEFIQRCDFFSVRDEYSANGVAEFRPSVDISMDPILLASSQISPPPDSDERRTGISWIPAKLTPGTTAFYSDLMRTCWNEKSDTLLSFNQVTDEKSGFSEMFPKTMNYIHTIDDFRRLTTSRAFSVSERYHGCIMSIKNHRPCIGMALRSDVVTSKITELYRRLGVSSSIITMKSQVGRSSLRKMAEEWDFEDIDQRITKERKSLSDYLLKCVTGDSVSAA